VKCRNFFNVEAIFAGSVLFVLKFTNKQAKKKEIETSSPI
jgi:hypothetical protein